MAGNRWEFSSKINISRTAKKYMNELISKAGVESLNCDPGLNIDETFHNNLDV